MYYNVYPGTFVISRALISSGHIELNEKVDPIIRYKHVGYV